MNGLLLAGLVAAVAWVAPGGHARAQAATLQITTTKCPGGTQGKPYAGCAIAATGGAPPYTFSVDGKDKFPPLPEGLSLGADNGLVSGAQIGGQGTYFPRFIVTDSVGATASRQIGFAINGANKFLATIFPSNSIFHHRVDSATTGLPVDTSPAAPIYSGYLSETVKPFFGGAAYLSFPNGIPAFSVPSGQPDVAVKTTVYQPISPPGRSRRMRRWKARAIRPAIGTC